jgi:hypothetical protein
MLFIGTGPGLILWAKTSTTRRQFAAKESAFNLIRHCIMDRDLSEAFADGIARRQDANQSFLRKVYNFTGDMNWLPTIGISHRQMCLPSSTR